MKRQSLMRQLFSLVCLVLSIIAWAQPRPPREESLELLALNSAEIFRGHLVSFQPAENAYQQVATVHISGTLKGKTDASTQIDLFQGPVILNKWIDQGHELLIFHQTSFGPNYYVIDLDVEGVEATDETFQLVKGKTAIIHAIEKILGSGSRVVAHRGYYIYPDDTSKGKAWKLHAKKAGYVGLSVPFDAELEKRARILLKTRDLRANEGMGILREYKSDENIALIRPFLSSTEYGWGNNYVFEPGYEIHRFLLRETAYSILTSWGENVTQPLFEESVDVHEKTTKVDLYLPITDDRIRMILRCPKLESLFMRSQNLTDSQLDQIGGISTLRFLSIPGATGISNHGLSLFAAKSKVERFWLFDAKVGDEGLRILAGMKSLKRLRLENAGETDKGLSEFRRLRTDVKIYPEGEGH